MRRAGQICYSGRVMANKLSAQVTPLEGVGHWWMLQDPERGAEALTAFWKTLD